MFVEAVLKGILWHFISSVASTFLWVTKTHFIKTLVKLDMKIILKSLKLKQALTWVELVPFSQAAASFSQ